MVVMDMMANPPLTSAFPPLTHSYLLSPPPLILLPPSLSPHGGDGYDGPVERDGVDLPPAPSDMREEGRGGDGVDLPPAPKHSACVCIQQYSIE